MNSTIKTINTSLDKQEMLILYFYRRHACHITLIANATLGNMAPNDGNECVRIY